jgi:hypothetical protein
MDWKSSQGIGGRHYICDIHCIAPFLDQDFDSSEVGVKESNKDSTDIASMVREIYTQCEIYILCHFVIHIGAKINRPFDQSWTCPFSNQSQNGM